MVGGMAKHLKSLRSLKTDQGIIHHLLEEAENERNHLFIFLRLKQPGRFYKLMVSIAQGIFFNVYFWTYLISPTFCHRFVGYLEEEAVHTYTILLKQLADGKLKEWENAPAPENAKNYYDLNKDSALIRDVILAIRADESIHRDCNHTFAKLKQGANVDQEILKIYVEQEAKQGEEATESAHKTTTPL